MPQKSRILFVIIDSHHKVDGGGSEYDARASIKGQLPKETWKRLAEARLKMLRWIRTAGERWEGTVISSLPGNGGLVAGPDFGGDEPGMYLSAIERYDGRFYQALGEEGRLGILASSHHFLIISPVYGLVTPEGHVQTYDCPVGRWYPYQA